MSELTERLRACAHHEKVNHPFTPVADNVLQQAAERIEELEAHLKQAGESGSFNGGDEFVVNDAWFEQTEYLLTKDS